MRIYIFKSEADSRLRAFAGDREGSKLPARFRPWHVQGVIAPEKDPPHSFPRDKIESAIDVHGFQLWRLKAAAPAGD